MMRRILENTYIKAGSGWAREWLIPTMLRRRTFGAAIVLSVLAVFYWGLVASDRYVSEAHVIIAYTNMPSASRAGSPIGGTDSGGAAQMAAFQLWLRDYLLSVDMMNALDSKFKLRAHYANWHRDPLSRMWFEDTSVEKFHDYYLSRISVELDYNSGDLVIKVQAYDPVMAHAIAATMVAEGERYMNVMSQQLAREQVSFLEKQVDKIRESDVLARQQMLVFQNRKGLISPITTATSIDTVVNTLDSQRAALQASRNALLAYLMPNNPRILDLDQQIAGIEKQINAEKARLVSPSGKVLNSTADEFQRLQMNVALIDTTYQSALAALEAGRIQAAFSMWKVFVLQAPTMPQYPLEPRRIYNTFLFILVTLILAGIVHLLAAIIRDHKD